MLRLSVLLVRAGLRKVELARELGLSKGTVSRWGDEAPRYAVAYLLVVIERNDLRARVGGDGGVA